MWIEPINCDEFLNVVGPALRDSGADELARRVGRRWTAAQLCQLLHDESVDVRKVACVVLGLVGDERVMGCLSAALRDGDGEVNQLAEHALWSIWFRGGSAEAQRHFKHGLQAMEDDRQSDAVRCFHTAHRTDPGFAEAYHQCAIAHYMLEQWQPAIDDCRRTIALVPIHFGALAALGHCHAQRGELAEAARCYRRALRVNPRMDAIAVALERISSCLSTA